MLSRNRKGIQSDKYIKKRRKRAVAACILFVVAAASAIVSLSLLSKADFLQITSVNVTGTNLVAADGVRDIVENGIAGNWLGIFSRDSLFLYPKDAIAGELMSAFPPIASVSFSHDSLHVLDVIVTERTPFALACQNPEPPAENVGNASSTMPAVTTVAAGDTCFDMDSTGFVYAPAPHFSPGVYVNYFITPSIAASSQSPVLGAYIADPATFAVAQQAVGYFSTLGLTPVSIALPGGSSADANPNPNSGSDNDYQILIKKPASATAGMTGTTSPASPTIVIYFNTLAPLDTTFSYFSAFWQHETDKNFQYIDLRYGKDIVFKMD